MHDQSVAMFLRAGRRVASDPIALETKFNPYHDPRNGRFSFAPSGSSRGRTNARGINGHGYIPRKNDNHTLARMIFSESLEIPGDFEAIGWTVVNRIGQRQYGLTLDQVLRKKGAFAIVEEGGGPAGGSDLWKLTAQPEKMADGTVAGWQRARAVAYGILNGRIPDPTGGATFFFASSKYDGNPDSAEGGFKRMLRLNRIGPRGM